MRSSSKIEVFYDLFRFFRGFLRFFRFGIFHKIPDFFPTPAAAAADAVAAAAATDEFSFMFATDGTVKNCFKLYHKIIFSIRIFSLRLLSD